LVTHPWRPPVHPSGAPPTQWARVAHSVTDLFLLLRTRSFEQRWLREKLRKRALRKHTRRNRAAHWLRERLKKARVAQARATRSSSTLAARKAKESARCTSTRDAIEQHTDCEKDSRKRALHKHTRRNRAAHWLRERLKKARVAQAHAAQSSSTLAAREA